MCVVIHMRHSPNKLTKSHEQIVSPKQPTTTAILLDKSIGSQLGLSGEVHPYVYSLPFLIFESHLAPALVRGLAWRIPIICTRLGRFFFFMRAYIFFFQFNARARQETTNNRHRMSSNIRTDTNANINDWCGDKAKEVRTGDMDEV